MNFRTTVILLILLLGVVAYVMFTGGGNSSAPDERKINPQRLLDISSADVSKVVLTPKDGKAIVLERNTQTSAPSIEPAKSDWKITSPITEYADAAKVSDFVDSVVSATSTSEIPLNSDNTSEFGLSDPQCTIEFQAGARNVKVIVGREEKAASELYVRIEGKDVAEVVGADLADKLDTTAEKLRLAKLVSADAATANWLSIARPADPLTLEKSGGQWEMSTTRPTTLPVEQTAAGDLITAIGGATAVAFGDSASDPKILIGRPRATVIISDKKPGTTQPTQSETIEFGQSDLMGKNVWVRVTPPGVLATVPQATMDSVLKSSLDLRDHNVIQIASSSITKIRIVKNTPAATQPMQMQEITRRPKPKIVQGPPLPATAPATQASTQPTTGPTTLASTQPVAPPPPPTEWIITGTKVPSDADDAKVDAAVASFNPLKVDKYLWGKPATRPSDPAQVTYLVTLTNDKGVETTVMFSDPGESASDQPWGATDDAVFNVPRAVITSLNVDFTKQ
jgi:hypothetical protein